MSFRRWSLCLLFGPATLAMAQPVPVVIDVNEITNATAPATRTESSLPNEIVRVGNDTAFFAATGDTNGRELWSHSASSLLTPWNRLPGPLSSDPRLLTPVGSNLYLAEKVADINASGVLETRERVSFANGTDPVSVTLTLGPGAHVMDIAPVGNTAMFAIAATTTEFYRTGTLGTTATLVASTNEHLAVGDMLDCGYGTSDGFLAFTSSHSSSRKLVALAGTEFTIIHPGEVDNLTADGTTLYFTAFYNSMHRLYRWTHGLEQLEELDSNATPIRHLMAAELGGENRIYYVKGITDAQVWHAFNGARHSVDWPTGTSEVKVTASLKVGDIPHFLGTGVSSGSRFWAIWPTDSSGAAIAQPVANLTGWSGCSQLVASGTDKLAFVGHYDAPLDPHSPRLGFVVRPDSTSNWGLPVVSKFMDLTEGAVPSSLVALDTRVVFSAAHRLKGLEPWYCEYPSAAVNAQNQVMSAPGAGKPPEIGEPAKPIDDPALRRAKVIRVP